MRGAVPSKPLSGAQAPLPGRVVIVGGGIAGLGAALGLSRAGWPVLLLERDDAKLPPDPDRAFACWERRGAPQLWHSHAFLARCRNLLRERLPDVLEALLACGAGELPLSSLLREGMDDTSPKPGDEELTLLTCRRVTFEWVLRSKVQDAPGIEYRAGCRVTGLLREGDRVAGLRLRRHGQDFTLPAALVVDASGRRSKLPDWLEAAGFPRPALESERCGVFYCSRFYRLRPGATPPPRDTPLGADLGFLKYAVFHGDRGVFSITLAALPEDRPLRALLHAAPFEAATRALPATTRWVNPALAEPISPVHTMDGLRNTRLLLNGDAPLAPGVVAIGDAAVHTNPLYGRGCSLGLVNALLLVDAIEEHGAGDPVALARALEAGVQRELLPWYELSRRQDREAAEVARNWRDDNAAPGAPATGEANPRAFMRALVQHGLIPALHSDASVLRAFMRSFNLLDPPGELFNNPELRQRVLDVYHARDTRETPVTGPDRKTLVGLLEAAASIGSAR